jgi:hypothetical protein
MKCRWILLIVVLAGAALTSGCATTNKDDVSSIPWNRPQNWEGGGALGGFRPPGTGDAGGY